MKHKNPYYNLDETGIVGQDRTPAQIKEDARRMGDNIRAEKAAKNKSSDQKKALQNKNSNGLLK